jgi:2-polyprenyl-3-methyl-5-hydroxy-6-metoxy-1,4-benzoquinol methylase
VISSEVLEHVENDRKAVKELWRVLKKRGVCAVSVPANPDLWDKSDEWAGHKRRYTKEGLISLFEGNGFKIEEVFFWGFPLVRIYNRFFSELYKKRGYARG